MRDRRRHRGQGASSVRATPTSETAILNTETTVQTTTETGILNEQGASSVQETPTAEKGILNTETTVQTTIEEMAQFLAIVQ